jgi:chromosome partitioning protein
MPRVKIIAVINQKGGVGKTTTVANLGQAIARRGRDVCLIDLDPQSQLTLHLGAEAGAEAANVYELLTSGADLSSCAVEVSEHLALIPSVIDLAAAEMELIGTVGREQILADRLAGQDLPYEFVLIDCPPSLGVLTLNALAAADELIIPLQAHFLALQGLGRLLETVSLVQRRINPPLRVGGVILCMFERHTRLAGEVAADLEAFFAEARGSEAPWADARIFQTAIRRNVKLAECPSYGKTIFDYEPNSHGAEDYSALAEEFLACYLPPTSSESPPPAPPAADAAAGPHPEPAHTHDHHPQTTAADEIASAPPSCPPVPPREGDPKADRSVSDSVAERAAVAAPGAPQPAPGAVDPTNRS